MTTSQTTVSLEHVTKRFDEVTAVKDLSLAVRAGRIYGLIGPNGAGKTTTIRMIVNITAPDSGSIQLFGQQQKAELQDRIGYLPEERGLYRKMRISDQLLFFAELKDFRGRRAKEAVDGWLGRMKLVEWKNKKAEALSKGMQQKIQFIAAVIHDPDLLILDEPFSGLDPINMELLKEILLEFKAAGKTIIFSTHLMELAEKICDDICLINRSQKVLEGSLRDVKRSFGRNSVSVRAEGGDGVLDDRSIVSSVKRQSNEVEALLAEGVDPQLALRRLVESGARITKFELVEPTLHDIFIEKVSGGS
ncbi:ATP-binding cassette domain-containing protein [soil metagenome]